VSVRRRSVSKQPQNFEKIKKELTKRKQELEDQLIQMHEDQTKFPQDVTGQDLGDQASSSVMESLRTSLQDTELDEYSRITKALKLIEEGTYGVCIDCSKKIAEKRLESYPNATRCVICQEEFEENSGSFF